MHVRQCVSADAEKNRWADPSGTREFHNLSCVTAAAAAQREEGFSHVDDDDDDTYRRQVC